MNEIKEGMKEQYSHVNQWGDKFYYSNKQMTILHREDGPAAEYADGFKMWYIDGKCISEEKFMELRDQRNKGK